MIIVKCIACGKDKLIYPSRINRKQYCSKECFYANKPPLTTEHKQKISIGTKNNLPSTSWKKGQQPWNTGKKGEYGTSRKGKKFEEVSNKAKKWKLKLSLAKKGKTHVEIFGVSETERRKKIIKEKVHPKITGRPRLDMIKRWKALRSEYNYDVDPKTFQKLRKHGQYKYWREKVLERDNYKCVKCQSTKQIEVDHIIPLCKNRHLMLLVENGQVLCKECHKLKTKQDLKHG